MALTLHTADPADPEARALLDELSAALQAITGDSGRSSFSADDVRGPRSCFVLARDGATGSALGCGALRPLQDDVAELKRPGSQGVGAALLHHLEAQARALGYQALWLETRAVNARALAFYERQGYRRMANYGRYVGRPEAVCLCKELA